MGKILFASDLDNTLLFSFWRKHSDDVCVERLNEREQGFMTAETPALLSTINREALFVPITARSMEQYKRIQWPDGCCPRYAATTNGSILLIDGEIDKEWYTESMSLVAPWETELERLKQKLTGMNKVKSVKIPDGMYLFAAFENDGAAHKAGLKLAGEAELTPVVSGRKMYFFPPGIDKGTALIRLKKRLGIEKCISAGDSVMDIPMLNKADVAIIPSHALAVENETGEKYVKLEAERFPNFILRVVTEKTS